MKIKKFTGRDGRTWFCGSGTHEEVESLNTEKDYDAVLNTLRSIKKTHNEFFDIKDPDGVDRNIYGKREAVRK